jgi:hypothetical protein
MNSYQRIYCCGGVGGEEDDEVRRWSNGQELYMGLPDYRRLANDYFAVFFDRNHEGSEAEGDRW